MSAPDRSVRSLRLRAGSEEEIGRVLPRLEDALRCASLPDTGSRMLLVRKLALGRIARDASSQTLSRLIELRMTEAGAQWVPGGTGAAGSAGFVSFASGLQARTLLALRLVRGEPCTEWYWPLAVPEVRPAAGSALRLRWIAEAIARLPEARSALPAWTAALVAAGGSARLQAAIDENTGEALLRQAGIALQSRGDESSALDPSRPLPHAPRRELHADARALVGPQQTTPPRWLRSLLIAQGAGAVHASPEARVHEDETDPHAGPWPRVHGNDTGTRKPGPSANPMVTVMAPRRRPEAPEGSAPGAPVFAITAPAVPAAPVAPPGLEANSIVAPAPPAHARSPEAAPAEQGRADSLAGAPSMGQPFLEPSVCAGLLFLLPVLVRLGIDAWSAQAQARSERFAQRVLKAALQRLDAAPDDPAWALIPIDLGQSEPLAVPPPSSWRDPLLAAPHAKRAEGHIGDALWRAGSAEAQAAVWLRAARRWLRRGAHIGLATLVLRPGFISTTPTHVDILFRVDDTDMRVRRAGLDLDPGWLPWFGRVVSFHYQERQA